MIDLRPDDHGHLQRLVRAGRHGLRLGDVPTGTAIYLSLLQLAEITTDTPQRVLATPQGAAFSRRQVFA